MAPAAPSRHTLDELARGLELDICVARLISYLFPGDDAEERGGRHRPLEAVIGQDTALRTALLSEDGPTAREVWRNRVRDHGGDLALLHDLAVIYRERALGGDTGRPGTSDENLAVATTLWVLLLATDEFWKESGLAPGARDAPRQKITGELIELHAARGAQALAGGRVASARLHLRCLDACRTGAEAARDLLDELGLRYELPVRTEGLAGPGRLAGDALDRWYGDLIESAETRLRDPEAIDRLPEGIREDFEGAIAVLKPLVGLGVPEQRVLSMGLGWHNDWCYCLYALGQQDGIRRVLESARSFADRLSPLCAAGEGHLPENRALSVFRLFRSITAADDRRAIGELEEALRWNPANDNAVELLVGARLRQGDVLAGQGRFAAALEEGEKARALAPGDERAAAFIQDMAGYASEESTFAAIRSARHHLEAHDHDAALTALGAVPSTTRFATAVRQLRMEAHLGKGLRIASEVSESRSRDPREALRAPPPPPMEDSAAQLRLALDVADRDEDRLFVSDQLVRVLNTWAVILVDDTTGGSAARFQVAGHQALALLDEALALAPGNEVARGNRADIYRALGGR